jgi:putative flippase GtrA
VSASPAPIGRQASRFIVVGAAAALTHWLVAVALMHWWPPLLANIVGFGCAFPVSFVGHWRWSFHGQGARWMDALPRFALVALSAFAANEGLYALALRWKGWTPEVALVAVLLAVAGGTFAFSRAWAFRARRADPVHAR